MVLAYKVFCSENSSMYGVVCMECMESNLVWTLDEDFGHLWKFLKLRQSKNDTRKIQEEMKLWQDWSILSIPLHFSTRKCLYPAVMMMMLMMMIHLRPTVPDYSFGSFERVVMEYFTNLLTLCREHFWSVATVEWTI